MRDPEAGNARLRRAVADVTVDRQILEEVVGEVRKWLEQTGAGSAYIIPGSSWVNGCCESLNGRLRDELLNGEIFYALHEVQVVIGHRRRHYNTRRPHIAFGYRPFAPEVLMPSNISRAIENSHMAAQTSREGGPVDPGGSLNSVSSGRSWTVCNGRS